MYEFMAPAESPVKYSTRPGSICGYFTSKRSRIIIVPASPIASNVIP